MIVIVSIWIISAWNTILVFQTNRLLHRIRRKRQALNMKRRSRRELDRDRNVPRWVHVRIAKIERQYEKRFKFLKGTRL